MKKRMLSLLMTLAMLLTIIPAAGITALAANAAPDATEVAVNDNKLFGSPNKLHFKNGDTTSFTGNETDYNAHYDPDTGVLTLKGYDGGRIGITGSGQTAKDITIELIGNNTVTGTIANNTGGDITITGSGSLTVTSTENNDHVYGIAAGFSSSFTTGNVTIKDNASVTINSTYTGTDTKSVYGIFAKQGITISGNASVNITCNAQYSTSNVETCYGLFIPNGGSGNMTIETTGAINIDVKNAGTNANAFSYGVYADNYDLKKVGSMTVEWKKTSTQGVPIYGGGAFDESNCAMNIDTTNCYASYRSGTPYEVTAENGTLSGPGVKENANSYGYFLQDDTVTLKAKELKVGEVTIPFTKWVSDDVSIENATNKDGATFTVPEITETEKEVTVTAQYNPCTEDGAPKFTYEGKTPSGNPYGNITFKLAASGTSRKLYSKTDLASAISATFVSGSDDKSYTAKIYGNTVPAGEYVIGVEYDNVMCYSEPFTVNYSETQKPAESISLNKTAITLTLNENATETLTATVTPSDSTDTVSWTSSNTDVATVESNGTVTAKAAGTATITATAGDKTATCTVTVKNKQIAVPTANTGLVYTGSEQQGVQDGEGYSLTGHKATNANTYTATATLGSGYEWSDGSTAAKQISWKIDQATPTYTPPTGLTGTKGTKLSSVTLPANWSWMDENTEMSETGDKTFKAKYTPDDSNYKTVENVDVTVAVSEAAPTTYTITVTNGKAFAADGASAGSVITEAAEGTKVKLTANTVSGKTFDKWVVESGSASVSFEDANRAETTFTMPAGAVSVKATYKDVQPTTFTLTTQVNGGHGTISAGQSNLAANTTVTVTFTPEEGYEINTVTVNGAATSVTGNTLTVTMDGDKTVVVTYKQTTVTPPEHPHHLTLVPANPATCTTPGNKEYYKCDGCDKLFEDEAGTSVITDHSSVNIGALNHNFTDAWSHDDSMHWHKCSRCDAKQGVANHDFGDDNICDTCGYDKSVPHEHTYGSDWKSDDTQHWHECSCGDKADIAAHTESDWIIDTPATATGYGTKHKECTVCGRRMQDARIEPTGSGTITIIVPSTEEPTKPADQKNPSTGAAPGSIGYDTLIGLAAAGALCIGAIKLAKKDED